MPTFTGGAFGNDFDQLDIISLGLGSVSNASSVSFADSLNGQVDNFYGGGFLYGANGFPTAGTVNEVHEIYSGNPVFDLTGLSLPITSILGWAATGADETARLTAFGGNDLINGSNIGSRLRGYDGDDTINGGAGNDFLDGGNGNDQVFGGAGNDVIVDGAGTNYLRGGDGDDVIQGGTGFDDINGNKGDDTIDGGPGGNDWLVGGQGNDSIIGHGGGELIYGNLGNDTLIGGGAGDVVRGGQGDDSIVAGAGPEYLSGDLGNDTIQAGSGADNFHTFAQAGIDRVLGFKVGADHVQVDPGTVYTLSQVGADTIIDMGGGNQMILTNTQLSSLQSGWIFAG